MATTVAAPATTAHGDTSRSGIEARGPITFTSYRNISVEKRSAGWSEIVQPGLRSVNALRAGRPRFAPMAGRREAADGDPANPLPPAEGNPPGPLPRSGPGPRVRRLPQVTNRRSNADRYSPQGVGDLGQHAGQFL
jgi:hypothetical protein